MITAPNDPCTWAAVCVCVCDGLHACWLMCWWLCLALQLDPVVVIEVSPCRSPSLFPVLVGVLGLVVASLVWKDLCCLLTWCLPAQLCLLSGGGEGWEGGWLASTPTHHCCWLCCVALIKVILFHSAAFPITCCHAPVRYSARGALVLKLSS